MDGQSKGGKGVMRWWADIMSIYVETHVQDLLMLLGL